MVHFVRRLFLILVIKHLCVDVIPVADADKIQEIKKEIVLSAAERWTEENCALVPLH